MWSVHHVLPSHSLFDSLHNSGPKIRFCCFVFGFLLFPFCHGSSSPNVLESSSPSHRMMGVNNRAGQHPETQTQVPFNSRTDWGLWLDRQVDWRIDQSTGKFTDGLMVNQWVREWLDGWINGFVGRWMWWMGLFTENRQGNYYSPPPSFWPLFRHLSHLRRSALATSFPRSS